MSKGLQKSWIAGLFAAFTASLCCIMPLLAILGGAGGASTNLGWVESYRPYIIGLTIAIFALAWYQVLKKKSVQEGGCGCEGDIKGFLQSKKFLLIVTLVSGLFIGLPYYSSLLYASQKKVIVDGTPSKKLATAKLSILGMSCAACTSHIDDGLSSIGGIAKSKTSFETAITTVSYDPDSISVDSISKKIKQIGYKNNLVNKK